MKAPIKKPPINLYIPPQKCEIINDILALVMSDKLSLTCNNKVLKDSVKDIMLANLGCTPVSTNCQNLNTEKCNTIIINNVSCSLCIFELDNSCNPCAMPLDEGTTYTNQLTENISPSCHS
jgi:hypothetical protein